MRCLTMAAVATITCIAAARGSSGQQQAGKGATAEKADKSIVAAEREIWEMFKQKDFDRLLKTTGGTIDIDASGIYTGEGPLPTAKDLEGLVTKSYSLDSVSTRAFGPDIVVLVARVTLDRTYKDSSGNSNQTPSPIYTMTVWQRAEGRWIPIAHSETPVMSTQAKGS